MKTLRYRIGNAVKPGILDNNGNVRDVSSLVKDWDNENVIIDKLNEVKKIDPNSLPLVERHDGFAPCVCKKSVGKFICIGFTILIQSRIDEISLSVIKPSEIFPL